MGVSYADREAMNPVPTIRVLGAVQMLGLDRGTLKKVVCLLLAPLGVRLNTASALDRPNKCLPGRYLGRYSTHYWP